MNFWREKYPYKLIEIDYDKFVLDYEKNSKKVIENIGLNWENEILKFTIRQKFFRQLEYS